VGAGAIGMASASAVVFIEQARRARERAAHLRKLGRSINDPETVERIEQLAREMEETAAQLEATALEVARTTRHTDDVAAE